MHYATSWVLLSTALAGCFEYVQFKNLIGTTMDEDTYLKALLSELPSYACSVLASLLTTGAIWATWAVFDLFFAPLHIIKPAASVQLPQVTKQLDVKGARLLHLSRKFGRFPPPYPNGWFFLCFADELKKGDVKSMNVLGGQYVLWRGSSGEPRLFDAYCPHMGANLGLGGTVQGDCLHCPFHGWKFDGSGACVSVPYTSDPANVPKWAKTERYTILETNNMIYFWHHADDEEPSWMPPKIPQLNNGTFKLHGKTEHHVLAHIQELPENGADVAHLDALHFPFVVSSLSPWLLKHTWEAKWSSMESKTEGEELETLSKRGAIVFEEEDSISHITHIDLTEHLSLLGMKLHFMDIKVTVNQVGPGIVWLYFKTPLGAAIVCETVTPHAPMLQRTCHVIYAQWTIPRFIAKFILYSLARQYERDVPIWQWKTFPQNPLLLKEDVNIKRFRSWYSQYYSKSSISFEDALSEYSKAKAVMPSSW